ncbi:hypothetical protein NLG97_g3029 [Lecanicillium saksenae]|uniref:Uncharacterized protein n=1 Tax=Lecanicillium saksenae TaxID=468837 RepID=A0ACC1R2K5_9HYPO|nr:hypothetical protein NLG97_g3029 [Lecanicillium saksenae]
MRVNLALPALLCVTPVASAAIIPPSQNLHAPRTIFQLPELLSCLGTLTTDIITNLGDPAKLKSQTVACLCQAAISTDGTLDFLLIGQLLRSLGFPSKQQDLEFLLGTKCKPTSTPVVPTTTKPPICVPTTTVCPQLPDACQKLATLNPISLVSNIATCKAALIAAKIDTVEAMQNEYNYLPYISTPYHNYLTYTGNLVNPRFINPRFINPGFIHPYRADHNEAAHQLCAHYHYLPSTARCLSKACYVEPN